MSDRWIDDVNRLTALPIVEQLRTIDRLEPSPELTVDAVIAAFDAHDEGEARALCDAVVRLLPRDRWLLLLDALGARRDYDAYWWKSGFVQALGPRIVPVA